MQRSLDMNTGACVAMVGTDSVHTLQRHRRLENRPYESPQVQFTPASPSRAPRTVHHLTTEISIAGGPAPPDAEDNSIVQGTDPDPMGYFNWSLDVPRAFDQCTPFDKERFISSWDDPNPDSDHHHDTNGVRSIIVPEDLPPALPLALGDTGVPLPVVKASRPATKSPETNLSPSEIFGGGGLKKAPTPSLIEQIELKDISIAMTGLETQITARHEHHKVGHKDPEQEAGHPYETALAQKSTPFSGPSAAPSDEAFPRANQRETRPSAGISSATPSDGPADVPCGGTPDPGECAFGPSTSAVSLAVSDNISDTSSLSQVERPRNIPRRPKGIPTAHEKSQPAYQARKHACQEAECGARFPRSDNLKRHIRTVHNGEPVWACPVRLCSKRCNREDNGIQHLQMEHDSTCSDCGAKFVNGKDLEDHLRNLTHPRS